MKKIVLIIVLGLSLNYCFGQTKFVAEVGNANQVSALKSIQTSDGGYASLGYMEPGNYNVEIVLSKFNSQGAVVWKKMMGDSMMNFATSIVEADNKSLILAGYNVKPFRTGYEAMLIKVDSSGNVLWNKAYGNTFNQLFTAMIKCDPNQLIIAGTKINSDTTNYDITVTKADFNGNIISSMFIGDTINQSPSSIAQTSDGFIINLKQGFSPYYLPTVWGNNALLKIDNNLTFQWAKVYGTNNYEVYGHNAIVTSDGGYLIASNMGTQTCSLIKTDSFGDTLWVKNSNNTYMNGIPDVTLDTDGNIIVDIDYSIYYVGTTIVLMKMDNNGNQIFVNGFFSNFPSLSSHNVCVTNDGGYLISGYASHCPAGCVNGLLLIKTDSTGNSCSFNTSVTYPLIRSNIFIDSIYNINYTSANQTLFQTSRVYTVPQILQSALGCFVGINEMNVDNNMVIAPNPTSGILTISFNEEQKNSTIKILNVLGEITFQSTINSKQTTIDISALPQGIYFVEVTTADKQVMRSKVIKE